MNEKLSRLRFRAAQQYGLQCFVCHRPYGPRFQFHHVEYPSGWKTYRDFKTNAKYNEYIMPRIMEHPDVFLLLCKSCHELVSAVQRVRGQGKFERLLDACRRSRLGGARTAGKAVKTKSGRHRA